MPFPGERTHARVLAVPRLNGGRISTIDMQDCRVISVIGTAGPGLVLRSHDGTPHVRAGAFIGPDRRQMQIIDKDSLEVVQGLSPDPGRTVAPAEFTRDARRAEVPVRGQDGAVIVFDTANFAGAALVRMIRPAGKYNVWNKMPRRTESRSEPPLRRRFPHHTPRKEDIPC